MQKCLVDAVQLFRNTWNVADRDLTGCCPRFVFLSGGSADLESALRRGRVDAQPNHRDAEDALARPSFAVALSDGNAALVVKKGFEYVRIAR